MARQVYYDPFGMRTEGYRAGVADEVTMQDQTRRARASDWDFQNMKPLQLQGAQRQEAFAQYADPFGRRQVADAEYDGNIERAMGFAYRTGNEAPARTLDFRRYVPNAEYYLPEESFRSQYDPNTGQTSMGFTDPMTGQVIPWNTADDAYRQYYGIVNPAISNVTQQNAQFNQGYRDTALQNDASMAWLLFQQQQALMNGNAGAGGSGFFGGF